MHDTSDMELLRDYDRHGSEAAFADLVERHIALVYSTAWRHVGIAAQAEEITQAVFIILARKAVGLRADTILEGWLYETTRLTALRFLRGERRRQFREQEAYMQSTLRESTADTVWPQLAPLLDEAMSRLNPKDRDAVMLRFFKDQSVRDVAAAMQISESAAQRRLLRAVEKLRSFFTKRGITVPAGVLTATLCANSIQAAPAALAKSVTAVAVAKGAVASGSTLTLIKGALKIMAWTKMKTAVAVGAIIILTVGTATIVVEKMYSPAKTMIFSSDGFTWYLGSFDLPSGRSANVMKLTPHTINAQSIAVAADGSVSFQLKVFSSPPGTDTTVNPPTMPTSRAAIREFGDWVFGQWIPDSRIFEHFPPMLLIRPAQEPVKALPFQFFGKNQYLAKNLTVKELITAVYSQKNSAAKIIFLAPLPDDKFDCVVTLQNVKWPDVLETAINKRFNLIADYQSTDAGSTVTVKNSP